MPRYREADRLKILAETKRRLLDAALAEFSQSGYENANVERISAAAGLAKGTVYNHFPSKRALMEALIDEIGAQHLEFIRSRVLAESDPVQRLRAFYRAGFAFVQQHMAQARLSLTTLNSPDPAFNQRLYTAYRPLLSLLAQEVLLPGARHGAFSDRLPLTTVSILMTLYLGSATNLDPAGKPYMDPDQVANFALAAIRKG